jgi:hypothetical protein
MLRRLLVQAAHYQLGPFGPDTDLRRWGLARAERGGKIAKRKAVIAVARKLAVLLHRLWVTAEVYEPLRNTERAATSGQPRPAAPPEPDHPATRSRSPKSKSKSKSKFPRARGSAVRTP